MSTNEHASPHARTGDCRTGDHRDTPRPRTLQVAVVGAGVSGLTAARALVAHGHRVQVFEKSRGYGGRAATRRHEPWAFDHGAQYFTADGEAFRARVADWAGAGVVAPWRARIGRVTQTGVLASPDDRERWVAAPGMSALGRHLADGLDVRTRVRVAPPIRQAGHWVLDDDAGTRLGEFDALIVSAPAPQTAALLAACAPRLAGHAAAVGYAPTWAAMLAFDTRPEIPFDGLFFRTPAIAWAARNDSKPGRSGNTWVVHATPQWTRDHLDDDAATVADELGALFCRHAGLACDDIVFSRAHRWLYSLVDQPMTAGALWDAPLRLGVCGDWCHGARIEGAHDSGVAVVAELQRHLVETHGYSRDAVATGIA